VDEVGDFKCVCEAEFTGKRCQHRIDDCLSEPCQHGGTCTDLYNGFECTCRPGFVGTLRSNTRDSHSHALQEQKSQSNIN
jgi:hypothetical protein